MPDIGTPRTAGRRQATETRLRASEQKYRDLVNNSLQGILVLVGTPPRLAFANPPCAAIIGCSLEELAAMQPDQIAALIHPDDRELVLAQLAERIAGTRGPQTGEARALRRDGTVRWIEFFATIVDFDGQPAAQIMFIDITERKEAEAQREAGIRALHAAHDDLERRVEERTSQLARTNALLEREIEQHRLARNALEQSTGELHVLNTLAGQVSASLSPDQVIEAALHGVAGCLGPDLAMLYLLQGDELVLRGAWSADPALQRVPPQLKRVGECLCGLCVAQGRAQYSANIHTDPRCTLDECKQAGLRSFAALPLLKGSQLLGMLGIGSAGPRDFAAQATFLEALTGSIAIGLQNALLHQEVQRRAAELELEVKERERVEREMAEIEILRQIHRLRSELIANVSHEIRTPLGLIKVLCTSLLMDDVDLDPEIKKEFLRGIREETDRLEAIVDNLLNLSRMEDGRMHLDRQPADLAAIILSVLDRMGVQLAQHRIVPDLSRPLMASVDERQIERLLTNLLTNAAKYSPEGSAITVRGRRDGSQLVVCVSDQGIGIPAAEHDKIFDRFYRVESELSQKVGGVGLGLAVCRGIVEMHGGRIWVESAPGQGSRFFVSLPAGLDSPSGLPVA